MFTFTFAFWPLTPSPKGQINTLFVTAYHVVNCISHSYFIISQNNLHIIGNFICQKWFRKWLVWILWVYCSIEQNFWWCHLQDMLLSTQWLEDDILWTLNDVFGQKLAILLAIWYQIRSSMYLRWNYIYIILSILEKVWMLESDNFNYEITWWI